MRKNNKTCIVCSTKYTYCSGCSEFDKYPRWMGIYHEENCKNIFDITSKYLNGQISKEEAKEELGKCDLSNKKNFNKSILDAVNKIMASDKKKKKEIIIEPIKPVEVVDEIKYEESESVEELKETIEQYDN